MKVKMSKKLINNLKLLPAIEAGEEIQFLSVSGDAWVDTSTFDNIDGIIYRIKPAPIVMYGWQNKDGYVSCIIEKTRGDAEAFCPGEGRVIKFREVVE